MIAPLRPIEPPNEEIDTLARARHYVAETLLAKGSMTRQRRARQARWKIGLLLGSLALVAAILIGRGLW